MTERKATVRFAPEGADDGTVLEQKKTYIPGWNPSENIPLEETVEWVSPPSVLPTVPAYLHDPLAPGYTDYVSEAGRIRVSDIPLKELPYNTGTGGTTMGLRSGQYVNRRGVLMQGSRGVLQGSVVEQLPALARSHGEILASQVAAEQGRARIPRIQVPYEPSYKRPASILKTATRKEDRVPLQAEEFEQKYVETPDTTESGIPAMLSRVNMNANKNADVAYNRFNRNVRPFLKSPAAATVKARKRGFFTGESKNSYRRTLKKQMYNLMRGEGSAFTTADALAELPYIFELAHDMKVADRVVYERMKDWITRYATDKSSSRDQTLDGIANLFTNLTLSGRRGDLQRAAVAAMRLRGSPVDGVAQMLKELEELKGRATGLTAANLYKELSQIVANYPDVLGSLPATNAALMRTIPAPKKRGFFGLGGNNLEDWKAIHRRLLDMVEALQRVPVPAPVASKGEGPVVSIPLAPVEASAPINPKVYAIYPYGTAGAAEPATTYKLVVEGPDGPKISTINTTALQSMNIDPTLAERISNRDFFEQFGQTGGRRKTTRHSRRMVRRTRKQKLQRGGATSMPLAWYQQGAQFQGTVEDPTGVGLAGASATWVRSALPAQGGGGRHRKTWRQQMGGFTPSVMGAGFAEVGMRLLPAAAYMGYNQLNNFRKQRHTRKRK